MKTMFILILLFIAGLNYKSKAQTPPPGDSSCYTDYYDCTTWTAWSNWTTVYAMFSETGNCQLYALYKTRHCSSAPSIVEIWIGQFGIVPPSFGENCDDALEYLYPNWPSTTPLDYDHAQKLKMMFYRQAVIQEFDNIPVVNRPICGTDEPIVYGMRFPGSCTMFCSYENNNSTEIILLEKACYETYCCGKTYSVCWQETPLPAKMVITEYTNGSTTGNCDPPTGNPPEGMCYPTPSGYGFLQATECSNSCNYGGE